LDTALERKQKKHVTGVNWSHRREALSWLVWFFMPLAGIACSLIMPFAAAHPTAFKVLLFTIPAGFAAWLVIFAIRKN